MDLNLLYEEQNEKRQADGMDPLPVEKFIEDLSFDMCAWLLNQRPELILERS
jgi:hypothetical protein